MNVRIIDPLLDSRWDDYVERHPCGCVFHHSAWKDVLFNTFPQLSPLYFIAEDDQGKIRGALPFAFVNSRITGKRLVSLPFSLYSDPLVDDVETFSLLIEKLFSEYNTRHVSFMVLRVRNASPLFQTYGFHEFVGYKNHILSIDKNIDEILRNFHRTSIRTHLRKAEQSGIQITEATSENDVKIFYNLHVKTRKKFGTPPQPYQFYQNMWKYLAPKNMLLIHTAWYHNTPICSKLCLKYKNRVHAEYIGMDEAYRRFSPNIFLTWKTIQNVKLLGYQYYELGGTPIHNAGLLQYKRRWGTVEEEIHHFFYPNIRGFSSEMANSFKYNLLSSIMKSMPDWLFIHAGKILYKHLGG